LRSVAPWRVGESPGYPLAWGIFFWSKSVAKSKITVSIKLRNYGPASDSV